jgi:Tol biopolymer transport system component
VTAALLALTIVAASLGALVSWTLRPAPPAATVTRYTITRPDGQTFTNIGSQSVAVSPDGSKLAYVANRQIYLRTAADLDARPIAGTDVNPRYPAFSPNGDSIVFASQTDRTLKRVAVTGGAAVTLTPSLVAPPLGISWAGEFLPFGDSAQGGGVARVSANGGQPETVVTLDPNQYAYGPRLLPDGDHVLFTLLEAPRPQELAAMGAWASQLVSGSPERWDKARIVVQSLRTSARTHPAIDIRPTVPANWCDVSDDQRGASPVLVA